MEGLKTLLNSAGAVAQALYGDQVPPWLSATISIIGSVLLILLLLSKLFDGLLETGTHLAKLIRSAKESAANLRDRDRQLAVLRRQRFAQYVAGEIGRIDLLEEWRDYKYAELEAEVEAEGASRFKLLDRFVPASSNLRREKSLSDALANSRERLVILEGDPGSGKSVSLRHIVHKMAEVAATTKSTRSVVPIYVNLKELELPHGTTDVTGKTINSFIVSALKRVNDRDIDSFIDDEFEKGKRDGSWFFLFDSFDEIPAVLGSTESDQVVRKYAFALADFLAGTNRCRGAIASRVFRGPQQLNWPRFRIQRLGPARIRDLILRAGVGYKDAKLLVGLVQSAPEDLREMSTNPLFLALLAAKYKEDGVFPSSAYDVYEGYVEHRFNRDADRLAARFSFSPADVRQAAEQVAFAMSADPGLGLSPTRTAVHASVTKLKLSDYEPKRFDLQLDALEFIKLARSERTAAFVEERTFTFAHRRFQEYFATTVVLRERARVPPRQLLTDARWRESAVVLCQTTQSRVALKPIIAQAETLLRRAVAGLPDTQRDDALDLGSSKPQVLSQFPWPSSSIHVLGLLQAGFRQRYELLPDGLRELAARLLERGYDTGTLLDKKWALEVVGIVPSQVAQALLSDAFANGGQLLGDVVFRQVGLLGELSEDMRSALRHTLIVQLIDGTLEAYRDATVAYLARLNRSQEFLNVVQDLLGLWTLDLAVQLGMALILGLVVVAQGASPIWVLGLAIVPYSFICSGELAWSTNAISRGRLAASNFME